MLRMTPWEISIRMLTTILQNDGVASALANRTKDMGEYANDGGLTLLEIQAKKNSATNNGSSSLQLALLNMNNTPI